MIRDTLRGMPTAPPAEYAAHVAAEVRAEMARQRKSLMELAEAIQVSRNTADARLKGWRPFSVDELALVAAWLGVPVSRFMPEDVA